MSEKKEKPKIAKDVCNIFNAKWDADQEVCKITPKIEELSTPKFPTDFNSMNWGKLIKNPSFVFRALINGKESTTFFGDDPPISTDHLGRVASMTLGAGITRTNAFIKLNDVQVEMYSVTKDGVIQKRVFKGKDIDNWDEIK